MRRILAKPGRVSNQPRRRCNAILAQPHSGTDHRKRPPRSRRLITGLLSPLLLQRIRSKSFPWCKTARSRITRRRHDTMQLRRFYSLLWSARGGCNKAHGHDVQSDRPRRGRFGLRAPKSDNPRGADRFGSTRFDYRFCRPDEGHPSLPTTAASMLRALRDALLS